MTEFNPELFTRLQQEGRLREDTLTDLKSELYPVIGNVEKLAEFIRDIIAFANASRRRGEPAYILFGVDDTGHILEQGIKGGPISRVSKPNDWDDDDPTKFERQQQLIGQDFRNQIQEYITPNLNLAGIEYIPGYIDGKLVSYIEIRGYNEKPFEVKKGLVDRKTGKTLLHKGDCWIRRGESKGEPISEAEKELLYSHRQVPYIKKSYWIEHLHAVANEYEQATFQDEPYIPLFDNQSNYPLRDVLDGFLSADKQILLVTGAAGSGKTTFLKQYVGYRAGIAQQNMDEEKPLDWIPAFFDLSRQHPTKYKRFVKSALHCFDKFDMLRLRDGSHSHKIFADRNLHVVICFDAFDEVPREHRTRIAQFIQQFAQEFPHLKIIITSRTGVLNAEWFTRYQHIEIAPFSESDCLDYFSRYLQTPEELLQWLQSDQLLATVMSTPLMIKATTEYWQSVEQKREELFEEQTRMEQELISLEQELEKLYQREVSEQEIADLEERQKELEQWQASLDYDLFELNKTLSMPVFQKGRFSEGVFGQLFDHEYKKSVNPQEKSLEISRLRKQLRELAFWMDGKYPAVAVEQAQNYLTDDQLLVLETLGLLQIHFSSEQVSFANELAKVYFATWEWIRRLENGETNPLTQEQIQNEFWQKCLPIALDFLPEEALLSTGENQVLS